MLAVKELQKSIHDKIKRISQRCCHILGLVNQRSWSTMNIIDPFVLPCLPLAWKHGFPKVPAIYFAISKKQILYIGSRRNLNERWSRHNRAEELKAFSNVKVAWYEVPDISELTKLEGQAISALKPFLNAKQRVKGDGNGYIYIRTVTKKGKEYHEAYYHYEFWSNGKCAVKSSKYIPKRLLKQIEQLEAEKVPVTKILDVLGVIYW